MIQVIGVDGFRIDAARHMPTWVFNFFDQAAFRANMRPNHDGTLQPVYMFSEVADGSTGNIQPYIRRDLPDKSAISTDDTTVKGNRDALDFPLFWRMNENLTSNGTVNNWHRIRSASQDVNDDGSHNGSQGVAFVDSHDEHSGQRPHLYKVAYAYTLMMPGNALVYLNAKEFGEGRNFPHDVGGSSYSMSNDALGGHHGDDIARLVGIRNTHGRGNFRERWIDDAFNPNGFSNIYIYEREKSALVGLNSRLDSGYDQRSPVQTAFAPNTVLVELTGNAANSTVDPGGNIPEVIRVSSSGHLTMRVPRNATHGKGYVVYGLATPQGSLSLTNVSQVLEGATPTQANNGTARLADIDVITANSFSVQLNTTPVTLPAPMGEANPVRDVHADGDRAMLRIDDGLELNGSGGIDDVSLTSAGYGFENFTTTSSPGYVWSGGTNVGTGYGIYTQNIDATRLSEGRHYLTVRAFRHRDSATGGDGGPAVFNDFKRAIYIDRLPPESAIVTFAPFSSSPGNPNNRDLIVRSVDQTADNMHFFLDLPANMTESQILAMVNGTNRASYYDRDQYIRGYNSMTRGNHVVTVVTYEPTGNYNIQRFPGQFTPTNIGLGFGDMNSSGAFTVSDIRTTTTNNDSVEDILYSQNTKFRPQFDVNGDGLGDNRDLFALGPHLVIGGAGQAVLDAYTDLLLDRGDFNGSGFTDSIDVAALYAGFGTASRQLDLNVDGVVDVNDVATMVTDVFRTVPGDFSLDGSIDVSDYILWRKGAGTTSAMYTQGDANFDRVVNDDDLAAFRSNFGFIRQPLLASGTGISQNVPPTSPTVPEPTTCLLIVVGFATRLLWQPGRLKFRFQRIGINEGNP
jgi:hypothetical protein